MQQKKHSHMTTVATQSQRGQPLLQVPQALEVGNALKLTHSHLSPCPLDMRSRGEISLQGKVCTISFTRGASPCGHYRCLLTNVLRVCKWQLPKITKLWFNDRLHQNYDDGGVIWRRCQPIPPFARIWSCLTKFMVRFENNWESLVIEGSVPVKHVAG